MDASPPQASGQKRPKDTQILLICNHWNHWLVVWIFIFPYIGNFIIPTDFQYSNQNRNPNLY